MKTTQQLYDIDPTQFADMLYPDVLAAKRAAAEKKYRDACDERFGLPYNKESFDRKGELDVLIKEADKALDYITLWEDELGLKANYKTLHLKATELCISAHKGQFRRGNDKLPYHTHPMAVASMVNTPIEKIVALLHDIVEDTDVTLYTIQSMFGILIAKYVGVLTHDESLVPYEDYIDEVKKYEVTTKVKLADMLHNSMSGPSDASKLKYQAAMQVLLK